MLERFTRGLYLLVHDHEKQSYGEQARRRWTQVHGEMIETRGSAAVDAMTGVSTVPTVSAAFTQLLLLACGMSPLVSMAGGRRLKPLIYLGDLGAGPRSPPARSTGWPGSSGRDCASQRGGLVHEQCELVGGRLGDAGMLAERSHLGGDLGGSLAELLRPDLLLG